MFRWTLQITDFGLHELRHTADDEWSEDENSYSHLWTAPELLRDERALLKGTQKGDIYAFGIILFEVFGRSGPYGDTVMLPEEIINQVDNVDKSCGGGIVTS